MLISPEQSGFQARIAYRRTPDTGVSELGHPKANDPTASKHKGSEDKIAPGTKRGA